MPGTISLHMAGCPDCHSRSSCFWTGTRNVHNTACHEQRIRIPVAWCLISASLWGGDDDGVLPPPLLLLLVVVVFLLPPCQWPRLAFHHLCEVEGTATVIALLGRLAGRGGRCYHIKQFVKSLWKGSPVTRPCASANNDAACRSVWQCRGRPATRTADRPC